MVTTKKNKSSNPQTRKNTITKTDTIIFVDDNLEDNIKPFRKHLPSIKSILVSDKKPYSQILKGQPASYYPIMYLKKYKDNTLAQESISIDPYTNTGQGISISGINKIIKWANQINPNQRTILFDWDKTISVLGGIFLPNINKNASDAAKFFSGTTERFLALQKMFFQLHKNNITCYIFTNNQFGNSIKGNEIRFNYFLQMVQVLDPHINKSNIIYGNANKVKTFKENKELMNLYRMSQSGRTRTRSRGRGRRSRSSRKYP